MFEFQDGFYADVRIEDRYSARIRYRSGAMEESTQSSVKKAFIRVYDGKMWYYSSVCDTGHIQAELDKLYAMATPDADILSSPVVSRLQANRETVMKFSDCCVKDVPIGQKRKLLTDAMAACAPCEYCKMYSAAYQDRYSVYEFYNSKGRRCATIFRCAVQGFPQLLRRGKRRCPIPTHIICAGRTVWIG